MLQCGIIYLVLIEFIITMNIMKDRGPTYGRIVHKAQSFLYKIHDTNIVSWILMIVRYIKIFF